LTDNNSNSSIDTTSSNLVDSTKKSDPNHDISLTGFMDGYISGDTRRSSTAHQFQSKNENSVNKE
jgi:hypothetical protein